VVRIHSPRLIFHQLRLLSLSFCPLLDMRELTVALRLPTGRDRRCTWSGPEHLYGLFGWKASEQGWSHALNLGVTGIERSSSGVRCIPTFGGVCRSKIVMPFSDEQINTGPNRPDCDRGVGRTTGSDQGGGRDKGERFEAGEESGGDTGRGGGTSQLGGMAHVLHRARRRLARH